MFDFKVAKKGTELILVIWLSRSLTTEMNGKTEDHLILNVHGKKNLWNYIGYNLHKRDII